MLPALSTLPLCQVHAIAPPALVCRSRRPLSLKKTSRGEKKRLNMRSGRLHPPKRDQNPRCTQFCVHVGRLHGLRPLVSQELEMENIAMLQLSNGALYEVGTAVDFIYYEIETVLPRGTWKTSKHMAEGCFAMQVVDFSDSNFGVGFFMAFNLGWENSLVRLHTNGFPISLQNWRQQIRWRLCFRPSTWLWLLFVEGG